MARRQVFGTMMMVACAAALWGPLAAQGSAADAAFATFWSASSPDEAARLVEPIVRAGVTFDEAFRRLQQGRAYTPRDTGVVRMENRTSDGTEHFFAVNVPDSYDPARRYQVRIQLHGGVGGRATNAPVGNGTVGTLTGAEQIYVVPYAWADAPWWGTDQVLNLAAIVDRVKRLYNVDENRVVLSGVSDGATGALYVAMRETTPFASILPLELLIHGWDLARSTGQDATIPSDLAEAAFSMVDGKLTDEFREQAGFKPPIEVPASASAQDKLLAYTGRQP